MSREPHVSIVTPVFNEEKYLAECIESVLNQTYPYWNYTIVDNCSTDTSVIIAQRYAARDSRVRVLRNTTFLQALQNCNAAVRQISPYAKYCKVVLADDWIYAECLERMVALAEANPSVGIVGAYALEGNHVALSGLSYETTVLAGREACRRHLLDRLHIFGTQNSVLYRADLVRQNDPFYNEANIQADTEVCYKLLQRSDFGFVHQVLTFTRVRPGSLNAVSLALETSWAAVLQVLTHYGSGFLTPDELQAAVERHMRDYYQFLGKCLLWRRDKKFWDYHKAQLIANAGGYERRRLIGGLLESALTGALNPHSTFSSLRRRLSGVDT